MIAHIKGEIAEKFANSVIIDVQGVGYEVGLTSPDFDTLTLNETVKLYTYHHIREQSEELFGFTALEGKKLFEIHLPDLYYREANSPIVLQELRTYKFINDTVVLNDSLVIQAFPYVKEKLLGGYAPADKWLKDRKGKPLTQSDIDTYKRIVQTLAETDTLMDEIEAIISFE